MCVRWFCAIDGAALAMARFEIEWLENVITQNKREKVDTVYPLHGTVRRKKLSSDLDTEFTTGKSLAIRKVGDKRSPGEDDTFPQLRMPSTEPLTTWIRLNLTSNLPYFLT